MRPLNLNLILWLCFLLFAVLLIVICTFIQNYELDRRYREQMSKSLHEAAFRLRESLSDELPPAKISTLMLSVTNQYNVSAYLFSENGIFVFPELPEEPDGQDYQTVVATVRERIEAFVEEMAEKGKQIDVTDAQAQITTPEYSGYALAVRMWDNEVYYLYLTSSFEMLHRLTADMMWFSLITALFAVVLSFLVSGFVSMLITKPVTEVTERAKELARGNYEGSGEKRYFCLELNELNKSLDYASSEIGKTDRMQKELIANVSHDFKTPLTMIKAYAAMIREISGDDPEKREKHTGIIIDEADRLAALVGDVLDLSRLQAGIDEAERTVFNLTEDVYAVVAALVILPKRRGTRSKRTLMTTSIPMGAKRVWNRCSTTLSATPSIIRVKIKR